MAISVFELFKIGIGPSSSHTVGAIRAALQFGSGLNDNGLLPKVETIKADLFGSLGATGKGHGSDARSGGRGAGVDRSQHHTY